MKILNRIVLFVLMSFFVLNVKAQEVGVVELYQDVTLLQESNKEPMVSVPLEAKYLLGSIKYLLADSSTITPSGIAVSVFQLKDGEEDELLQRASTNGKGVFYLKNMSLGYYKLSLESRNEVICERYFMLSEIQQKKLESVLIPMTKVEEKTQQTQQYEEF